MGLRLVLTKPLSILPAKHLTDAFRTLGEQTCPELELPQCSNPETILRRMGFEIEECDDTGLEILGRAIYCPRRIPLRELGLLQYRAAARARLLGAKRAVTDDAICAVADSMILPRHIAYRAHKTELGWINLYVPIEYLHYLYVRHRGSGQMPAVVVSDPKGLPKAAARADAIGALEEQPNGTDEAEPNKDPKHDPPLG